MTRGALRYNIEVARILLGTGMVRPQRPDRLVHSLLALKRWGATPAAGYMISATRYPDERALVDERGTLTFRELHRRTNALARGLQALGLRPGQGVAIMCRNHRGFIETTVACSKVGLHSLYLNTAFAGPQIAEVLAQEDPAALVYDEEFSELVAEARRGRTGILGWSEAPGIAAPAPDSSQGSSPGSAPGSAPGGAGGTGSSQGSAPGARARDPSLEALMEGMSTSDLKPPERFGRVVILTSGTTGTPKGASRRQPHSLEPAAAFFSRIPMRARETTLIAAPMFHSWGLGHFTLGLPLSSTLILRRRFDPEDTLRAVAEHRASALIVVPIMLQRILELPPATVARYDTSSLRIIAASGSALPADLAERVMDRFGDVLYNLYGSTEVAWATVATPADLRAAPGTAGRPPLGTVLRVLDERAEPVPRGATGRIFVRNSMVFDGYTGGGGKEMVSGLLSTGDVGHLDAEGRLFVDGRDDEMIVSGGENVFPREVEDLLAGHQHIEEVAVIGVEDEEFGQRLKAFVVVRADVSMDEEQVKDYVKQNLARFKTPREVVLVESLPRTSTGKVLKRELDSRE